MLGSIVSVSKRLVVLLICWMVCAPALGSELLTNGSFETPEISTPTTWTSVSDASIAEWGDVLLGEDPHLWSSPVAGLYLEASDGDQYAATGGQVTMTTQIGQVYVVTWKAYGHTTGGNAGNDLTTNHEVTITGGTLDESQYKPGKTTYDYDGIPTRWMDSGSGTGGGWAIFTTTFTATTTTVKLTLGGIPLASGVFSVAIDDVSVIPVGDAEPPEEGYRGGGGGGGGGELKNYDGPLDLIVGAVDWENDTQVAGNEDQEDEGGGIQVLLSTETPIFAMISEALDGGTATLSFINLPQWVVIKDSSGALVEDGKVTWTTDYSDPNGSNHADGNSRWFTIYSQRPFDCKIKLTVDSSTPFVPDPAEDEAKLYGVCACPLDSMAVLNIGSIRAFVASVDVRIDLGTIRYGDSAGYLHLKATEPSADLYTPGALQIFAQNDLTVTDFDQNGGTIKAPIYASDLWGVARVTVESATEYRIAFYDDENTMNADTTNDDATAFRVLTVKKPAGTTGNDEIYISETQRHSGTTTRYWHYEYSSAGATETWVLTEGRTVDDTDTAIRVTRREETTVGSGVGAVRTETLGIYEPADTTFLTPIYEVEEVYTAYAWGEELTSRTVDPDGLEYKVAWTYETDTNAGDNYGRLITYESATGYWERYSYTQDASNMVYRDLVVSQLHNNALDTGQTIAVAAGNNIASYLTRTTHNAAIGGGSNESVYVEASQVKIEGVLESSSYKIVRENVTGQTDLDETWLVASTVSNPVTATSATNELDLIGKILQGLNSDLFIINRSWFWKNDYAVIGDDSDPAELYKTLSPDGVMTVIDRTYSFRRHTTVTTSGYDTDTVPDGVVDYATRSTVVQDSRGNVESALGERAVTQATWFIESYVERTQADTFGRPTVTGYYFGADAKTASTGGTVDPAFQTLDTHACCGTGSLKSHTDRGGVRTLINMDALGRQISVTSGDGSTSAALLTEFGLDAAGNVLTVTAKPLAGSAEPDRVVTSTYNVAGQVTSVEDPEGRSIYLTYRRVTNTGAAYDIATDTGAFYWETRQYGNDNSVPVGIAWSDSQGDPVLSFTATTSWNGAAVPTATETLSTEHTRAMTVFEWVDLNTDPKYIITSRVYHDLGTLAFGLGTGQIEGGEGTNYLTTSELVADPLGRVDHVISASGNITAPVYENETGFAIGSEAGVALNDLKQVSGLYFNEFNTGSNQVPTGDRRPYITRAYVVRPGLNDFPEPDGNMNDFRYVESDVDFNVVAGALVDRTVWAKPGAGTGPWSSSTFNAQGQLIRGRTYENGDTNTVLTASDYTYITGHTTDNNGRLEFADRLEVDSGSVQDERLRTELYYNDAGYQVKTFASGRGMTKIELDDYGRMARSVFASDEGTNTDIEGTNAFTDDIVLTETVYGYNKANQVIQVTTYDRVHDAAGSVTGLLSAASAGNRRVNYSANWYDDNARLTHTTNYGTNGGAAFTRPASASAPDTSDDRLTSKVEYDTAGYAYLTTDNEGVVTRRYYNNAGQMTYLVENYVAGEFTNSDDPTTVTARDADTCRITAYGYDFTSTNAAGLRTTLTAIDPDGDGDSDDNQVTSFIYTGDLDLASDKRGWVPTNTRLAAVLHADAFEDGTTRANVITEINNGTYGTPGNIHGDFVYAEVYAGGESHFATDQRGVVWTNTYTEEGYLDYRAATAATGSGWTAPTGSDLRYEYTYGDAGERLTATAFDVTTGGAANRTSLVSYVYDGFYNSDTQTQDHNPTAIGPKTERFGVIDFDYDTTAAANIYTNAHRRNQVTYPNGRVIKLHYAPATIDHDISRASGIDEVIGGNDTAITRYSYMGSGRLARKDYTTPDLRLDFVDEGTEGDSGTDDYDASWDRFGRTTRCQWESYDSNGDGAGVSGSSGANVFLTRHGYDRVSNKLYDQREVYGAYSNIRRFDDIHRMVGQDQGIIVLDGSGDVELDVDDHASVDAFWAVRGRDWNLDQIGNPTSVDTESSDARSEVATNEGNEIETFTSDATERTDETATYFTESDDRDYYTESLNCTISTDVTVDSGNDNRLVINAGSTTAPAIILTGENRGVMPFATQVQSPANTGLVGKVFGYKSATDYWVLGINFNIGNGDWEIYHMHDADSSGTIDYTDTDERELIGSYNYSHTTLNTWYTLYARTAFNAVDVNRSAFDLSAEGGFPSGRYGLYTEVSGAKFNYDRWMSEGRTAHLGAAWETTGNNVLIDYDAAGDGKVSTSGTWHRQTIPVLLRGVRASRFEATFSMLRYSSNPSATGYFVFNYQGPGDYDQIRLEHNPTAIAPSARSFDEGATVYNLTEDRDATEAHGRTNSSDIIWYRVVSDGVDVKVFAATTEGDLDTKQTADDWCMRTTATTDRFEFSDGVGQIGFAGASYNQYWDNVTVKTDPDDDADLTDSSTYETTEIEEDFILTSGDMEDTFVYDDCGNLTFNGYQRLTYDANNRLIKVENAYWHPAAPPGQEVTVGSVVATHQYDASGRLIVDERYDAEGLADTIHRYYVGHCEVESRNGSNKILSQQVWDSLAPGRYIDSLAQVAHNLNPSVDDDDTTSGTQDLVDTRLYALQDASYCVMGMADSAGTLVERYEYDAYGQRFVYQRAGADYAKFAWIDVDGDGVVGSVEQGIVQANDGSTVTAYDRSSGDFNGDGTVDNDDLTMVTEQLGVFGASSNDAMVMTPASGGGSVAMDFGPGQGQALNDFGFQGLRYDPLTGLNYNRARWYDPTIGRFINTDPHPAIFPDGMSRNAAYHVLRGGLDPSGMIDLWSVYESASDLTPLLPPSPRQVTAAIPIVASGVAGAGQGVLNAFDGLKDGTLDTIELGMELQEGGVAIGPASAFGFGQITKWGAQVCDTTGQPRSSETFRSWTSWMRDWSEGAIVDEDPTSRAWSKGLGGAGLSALLGTAWSRLGLLKNMGALDEVAGAGDDLIMLVDDVPVPASPTSPGLAAIDDGMNAASRGAPELGGFARGISADEIAAINGRFSNGLTLTGDVDTILANASHQTGFFRKSATVIRDIAGRHCFQNGNKRTAQEVVELLMRRNNIMSGPSSATLRNVIDDVAKGNLRDIDEIANALRGFE